MSPDTIPNRAAQIRAAVADGHHTVTDISRAVGLSPRRVRQLLPHVPGVIVDTVPCDGPRPMLWVDLPVSEADDDEPWSPKPWVHPYRAARGAA